MLTTNIISERHHRSWRSVALRVAIPMVLLAASSALARAQVLDDFKDRDRVREWKVVSDAQVPGATGQVSSADGVRDGSLRLDFDFKCEGGRERCDGRSIGVTRKLAPAAPGEVLSLWVRCTACEIGLAVTDGSGQRLRYAPASLPLSARSLDAWQRVIVSLPRDITSHGGGANDGNFTRASRRFASRRREDPLLGSKGYLEVDDIGLYGSMAEASGGEVSIDLAKREFVPISADGGKSASAVGGVTIGKGGASRVDAASRVRLPFGAPRRDLEYSRKSARRVRLRVGRRGRSQGGGAAPEGDLCSLARASGLHWRTQDAAAHR